MCMQKLKTVRNLIKGIRKLMSHSNSIIPHNQQDEENKGQAAAAIRRLTPHN